MEKNYVYQATIVSIYDGDTVRVDIDLGFDIWIRNETIRLNGIDTPEIRGEERQLGLFARDYLRELMPIGSKIVIQTIRDKKEKYGRYLADIYVGNLNVNQELIRAGFGEVYLG